MKYISDARLSEDVWIVIVINIWPDEETKTVNNSCVWHARCEVDGVVFETKSRRAPVNNLARKLQAAGIPDISVRIVDHHGWILTSGSFYELARWTYVETESTPLRRGRFYDLSLRSIISGEG